MKEEWSRVVVMKESQMGRVTVPKAWKTSIKFSAAKSLLIKYGVYQCRTLW